MYVNTWRKRITQIIPTITQHHYQPKLPNTSENVLYALNVTEDVNKKMVGPPNLSILSLDNGPWYRALLLILLIPCIMFALVKILALAPVPLSPYV